MKEAGDMSTERNFYGFEKDVKALVNCTVRKNPNKAGLLVDLDGQNDLGFSTSGLFIHNCPRHKVTRVFYVRPELNDVETVCNELVGPHVKVWPEDHGDISQGSLIFDYEDRARVVVPYEFGEVYLAMLDLLYEKAWHPVESPVVFFHAFLNKLGKMTGHRLDLGVLSCPQRLATISLYNDLMVAKRLMEKMVPDAQSDSL